MEENEGGFVCQVAHVLSGLTNIPLLKWFILKGCGRRGLVGRISNWKEDPLARSYAGYSLNTRPADSLELPFGEMAKWRNGESAGRLLNGSLFFCAFRG